MSKDEGEMQREDKCTLLFYIVFSSSVDLLTNGLNLFFFFPFLFAQGCMYQKPIRMFFCITAFSLVTLLAFHTRFVEFPLSDWSEQANINR